LITENPSVDNHGPDGFAPVPDRRSYRRAAVIADDPSVTTGRNLPTRLARSVTFMANLTAVPSDRQPTDAQNYAIDEYRELRWPSTGLLVGDHREKSCGSHNTNREL
uniref:GMC family oxidoreductase n=1 Tax=Anisakis simplex TaxID=6269 RepID=A0A0M3JJF8_ANISI